MPFLRRRILPFLLLPCLLSASVRADSRLSNLLHVFKSLPDCGVRQEPCLPTPNTHLTDDSTFSFAARTRTNEKYGMPGWTRSQGSHFHKGVDILPTKYEIEKGTVRISYYDSKNGRSFSRNEPVLAPKDEIFTILDGVVVMANKNSKRSGYGCYVMVEHEFADGTPFISMYAHMDRIEVEEGQKVTRGEQIGWMGRTSSNPGGRSYLRAIPHCHFEVGRVIDRNFASSRVAKKLSPAMLGGMYDPRNIQPYNPVEFLRTYRARPRASTPFAVKGTPQLRDH